MRCAVCSGPMLYDRIDNESRCLLCGRPEKHQTPRRAEEPRRIRVEYPRRYRPTVAGDQAECWG